MKEFSGELTITGNTYSAWLTRRQGFGAAWVQRGGPSDNDQCIGGPSDFRSGWHWLRAGRRCCPRHRRRRLPQEGTGERHSGRHRGNPQRHFRSCREATLGVHPQWVERNKKTGLGGSFRDSRYFFASSFRFRLNQFIICKNRACKHWDLQLTDYPRIPHGLECIQCIVRQIERLIEKGDLTKKLVIQAI